MPTQILNLQILIFFHENECWYLYLVFTVNKINKQTKFCEIKSEFLSYVVPVKSTVEILQNFEAFSEYMNFNAIDFLVLLAMFFWGFF